MNERQLIETLLFINVGLLLHINRWHMLTLTHGYMADLSVNSSSAMFFVSAIILVASCRPTRRGAPIKNRFLRLALLSGELLVTVYVAELVLLKLWRPVLKLLAIACHFVGHMMKVCHIFHFWPRLFLWLRSEGFYFARAMFSTIILMHMMDISGMLDAIIRLVENLACRFSVSVCTICVRHLQRERNRQVRRITSPHIVLLDNAEESSTAPIILPAVLKREHKNRKLRSRQSRKEKRVNNLTTTTAILVQNSADDESSC